MHGALPLIVLVADRTAETRRVETKKDDRSQSKLKNRWTVSSILSKGAVTCDHGDILTIPHDLMERMNEKYGKSVSVHAHAEGMERATVRRSLRM